MIPTFNLKEIRAALGTSIKSQDALPVPLAVPTMVRDLGDVKSRFNVFRWGEGNIYRPKTASLMGSEQLGSERVSWMWVPRINTGVHRGMVDISEASSHQVLSIPGDPMRLMEKYWNFPFRGGMTVNEFGNLYEELVYRKCAYLPKKEDWFYKITSLSLLFSTMLNTGAVNQPWISHPGYPKGWYPADYGPRWVSRVGPPINYAYIDIKAPTFTPCDSAVTIGQGLLR